MNMTAKQFVNIKTFAIEIGEQLCVFLASCLKVYVDEEWTTGKLLHDQIARGFTCRDLLASSDVFDEFRCFCGFELFQTQHVEQFEVAVCVVSGFENLAAKSGKY